MTALLPDPGPALAQQRSRLAAGAAALQAALARELPDWRTDQAGRRNVRCGSGCPARSPPNSPCWRRRPASGSRPGPRFGPDGTMASYLRLPFSQSPERLAAGVARLATVAGQAAQGARSSLPGWLAWSIAAT